jgi:ATP-dependent Clp protease ATP-binding subunit ClpA
MPKINVYLPDELAAAVRDAQVPVSAICQSALERAVRHVSVLRGTDDAPAHEPTYGPFTRFTGRARTAIAGAQTRAIEHHHDCVGTEHLLLGVLDERENLAIKMLTALDVEPDDLRAELVASLKPASPDVPNQPPFSPLAKKALEMATKESAALGHNYVGCEHLLLGLLRTEDGLASQVLRRMGLELRTTRRTVVTALAGYVQAREQHPPEPSAAPSALAEILRRLEAIERRLAN